MGTRSAQWTPKLDKERRIPPFAEDALTLLTDTAGGTGEGLSRDEAIEAVTDVERFTEADAEDALAQLESRGYIYYADEQVPITPTDRFDALGVEPPSSAVARYRLLHRIHVSEAINCRAL